ncbi:serine--tRNA ligase [Patescibacteria group bacterium]|nr:serine--tRNA ligase [Patescibacteria group bacterium]
MLDIKVIRNNPGKIKKACQDKQVEVDIDRLLKIDQERRKTIKGLEELRAEQNKISKKVAGLKSEEKQRLITKAKQLVERIEKMDVGLNKLESEFNKIMLLIPNPALADVKIGKDESENEVLSPWGKIPKFSFKPKDHLEIGQDLDLIDVERASKVSGTRFSYLKNEAVLLECALVQFAFESLIKKGFIPIIPPVMLKKEMAQGTGYFEATDEAEAYFIPKDKLYLVGTSEQSILTMHADEVFKQEDLPRRYVGFSTCFRREAGSYGKDTKGIFRVHQFDKVEMFSFCLPEKSIEEHKLLLSIEEKLAQVLKIPYQVVKMCTGDLGAPAVSKYDIECWLPGQNKYRETHSTSNCTDFQARRLNIRFRHKQSKLEFVHTLNGTAFAIGRILIAILENYQQKDGSVKIPKVLQKYIGINKITKK